VIEGTASVAFWFGFGKKRVYLGQKAGEAGGWKRPRIAAGSLKLHANATILSLRDKYMYSSSSLLLDLYF
jgi:hypothetical protein